MRRFITIIAVVAVGLWGAGVARAGECDNPGNLSDLVKIQQCIGEVQQTYEAISKANANNKETLKGLQNQIAGLKNTISGLEESMVEKEKSIDLREAAMGERYDRLALVARNFYIRSRRDFGLGFLLSGSDIKNTLRVMGALSALARRDRDTIVDIGGVIRDLEEEKKVLGDQKVNLEAIKVKVDGQAKFYEGEVAKASEYEGALEGQIASLTARQNAILAEKSGTFQTTVGDVPLADDPNARPDYNPGFSPAFAAFSFGAPHFKGMSQYGALGRSKAGQNYEQILKAYYGSGIEIRDHDQNTQIVVDGYGSFSLEEYAKRIYEVPNSWGSEGGMEALKAQAVAARSYALARGGTICATEACQVFKPGPKGGNWESAVNATAGKVVYANGSPFSTWYSSTSGGYMESYSANGYSTPGFWDTPSGRSGWTSQAYEKTAESPWFYKGWYKTRSGDSCGRSHPWLTSGEMADVLNGWKVLYEGGGDSSRVTPLGSCWGGNPYSMDELKQVGGYTGVSGVSVTYSDGGVTANVTFVTNKGSVTINGNDFYKAFNLRAPGRISLKSGLFNIEKK